MSPRLLRRRPTPPDENGPVVWTPPGLEVEARQLWVGDLVAATVAVVGYPREVGPGWLEPLLSYPGRLDVSVHVDPIAAPVAALRLRRQLARLESGRRAGDAAGKLADPLIDAATYDAEDLAGRLARGEDHMFTVGLYATIYAEDPDELVEEKARVTALAHSLLLAVHPTTYRMPAGWASTLPLGSDLLGLRRTMDTSALAAGFPFTTPDLPLPDPDRPGAGPVVYGPNLHSAGLVAHDRWAQANYNSVTLASSGAGKSYLTKLDVLRSLFQGAQVAVIDPEDEYAPLAAAVGGTHLPLGAPGVRLNPLDLPAHGRSDPDLLTRRALFTGTLLATLLTDPDQTATAGLDAAVRAALDRAILAAYRTAGITGDQATWTRPPPLLRDVATALGADPDPAATTLAARLEPFTTGSHRSLFDGPTTLAPEGHLVVYSLRALPAELRAAGTLLTLDAIWRTVADPARRRRRLVVIDEAWQLMAHPAGATFLRQLAKAARKHWTGLALVTQDAADLLATDQGRAVVANAATHLLLRQDTSAATQLTSAFGLSDGEMSFLLSARPGDALLLAGPGRRAAFRAVASDDEHALITTDPAETPTTGPHTSPAGPAAVAVSRQQWSPADDADPL
ncbi:ATP-binding protein [Frankia sp. AgB1.9]|uniref:VirB4 family type IV secretion system protein n=1 Tax=unclassified Frankia TaxID=2632575 RepID=UPI0019311C3F|nr:MULTISPECIES: ATP-binding protein [unclassified Frankia]MBL7491181.1 ATP-binding protein [Frankia sp. AgW1.1]MBL7553710.1 ATP-binding protein [Frankia sp. AgB1.9]MBL7618004.1 ATP-binding protein [Frankia sp. AgB1.8]